MSLEKSESLGFRVFFLTIREVFVQAEQHVNICNLHVFSDRGIADGVSCCRDAGFAAIATATAVKAGHVHPVQVIMVLSSP